MRVYEFSKTYGIPSKKLVAVLNDAGFNIESHMAVLNEVALNFLEKKFNKNKEVIMKINNTLRGNSQDSISEVKFKNTETVAASLSSLILEPMTLSNAAHHLGQPVNAIILKLLEWGIVSSKNKVLSEEVLKKLADHFNVAIRDALQSDKERMASKKSVSGTKGKEIRPPVIVVLGHVDHGKTTLLDYIRKTRVTEKEYGGITQHLGAYEVKTKYGDIVFLDTPGHEAFQKIRIRGACIADMGVLVVAADDSIMPQTIEAIKHAKEVSLPIIVAINKIDKVQNAQIEEVKRGLAQYDLLPEEWGGDVVCVPISAKEGTGIDHLLEMLSLKAELMELRTDSLGPARGYALESKLERGRGSVATILLKSGQAKIGDHFVCGESHGKITSIIDSRGNSRRMLGPLIPAQIAGFDKLVCPGDEFSAISKAEYHAAVSMGKKRLVQLPVKYVPTDSMHLILKFDTYSSGEAIISAINKLSKQVSKMGGKPFNILYSAAGNVIESDVILANDTNAYIVAFHISSEPNSRKVAKRYSVSIANFTVIYELLDYLKELSLSKRKVEIIRKKIGEAVVRRVFNIKGVGVIAGCYVQEGYFSRDGLVVIWREKNKIGEGKIVSLQRDKKNLKEVHAGFECAFSIEGITDWAVEDRVECFLEVPKKR